MERLGVQKNPEYKSAMLIWAGIVKVVVVPSVQYLWMQLSYDTRKKENKYFNLHFQLQMSNIKYLD